MRGHTHAIAHIFVFIFLFLFCILLVVNLMLLCFGCLNLVVRVLVIAVVVGDCVRRDLCVCVCTCGPICPLQFMNCMKYKSSRITFIYVVHT